MQKKADLYDSNILSEMPQDAGYWMLDGLRILSTYCFIQIYFKKL